MKPIIGHYLLVIIALSVTISVAAIFFFMRGSIHDSVSESIVARQEVRTAAFNQSKEEIFSSQYEETANEWAQLSKYFVGADDIVKFIESVEALGKTVGSEIKISSIYADDLESAEKGTVGNIRAVVNSEGSWSSMMRILRLAESMPYKVSISDVNLDVSTAGTDKAVKKVWNLTFKLEAAMMKLDTPVGALDGGIIAIAIHDK